MSGWNTFRDIALDTAANYFGQYTGGASVSWRRAQQQHKAESNAHDRQKAADRAAQAEVDAENARYAAEQANFNSQVGPINTPGVDRVNPVVAPYGAAVFGMPPMYLIGGTAVLLLLVATARR